MATPRRDIFKMLDGFTNRRGLGYARYSSDMQKDGWTIQAQVRTITDHLAAKGIPIEAICKDEAKSAKTTKTTDRAGLQEALALIREGRANMLVVAKLDRATRALFDALGLDRELKQYGASLYCIEENIDTSDPQSTFLFQIHAIMAQRYRENLAFETAKGKRERVEDGLANGDPPYGYRRAVEADLPAFVGDAEALVTALRRQPYIHIPERAAAIRLAFELGATGCYSDTDIAEELSRRGYRMVSKRQPAGGPFKKDTIGAILRDPFYCGRVSYDGLKVHGRLDLKLRRCHGKTLDKPGKHEPLISQELFDRVQAVRAGRRRGAGGRTPVQERVYIAAKLAHCTVCEETLRANTARDKAIYRAAHRERGIPCTATRGRIDATLVHDYLAGFIASITLPPSWHAYAMDAVRDDETARHQERERAALQAKLARLKGLVKEGPIEPDEYRADKARIDAQLTALQHETTSIDLERATAQLANLTALWAEATDEERRAIVHGVVEAVWVDLDGNRVDAVQPKARFYPLREAFPATWAFCGTDEIRTRDLLRDRQAC